MSTPTPDRPLADPQVVETNTAILFFVGDHVYKLKKAVDLGFVDQTDREARRRSCEREVELNRRLAPDVYLGVLSLVDDAGNPVDHVVDMRRLPDDRRLSRCIARGDDVEPALRKVAHDVATLHLASAPDPTHDLLATRNAVLQRWRDGFDQLSGLTVEPSLGNYNVTKAALIHLTKTLAKELAPTVRVNALAPGLVKTDMARALWEGNEESVGKFVTMQRLGEPDDIANAALFLASDAASWICGHTLVVDGGMLL